jgi:hypothetical protein
LAGGAGCCREVTVPHLMPRMEIQLPAPLGLAAPLLRRRMRPELERDIATIKARLEAQDPRGAT